MNIKLSKDPEPLPAIISSFLSAAFAFIQMKASMYIFLVVRILIFLLHWYLR